MSPVTPSIANGSTQQFTATGHYSDGSTQDLTTQATWASSDPAVATVDSSGLATAIGLGSTTVSATSGGVGGSTSLTVVLAPPSVNSLLTALLAAVTGVGTGGSLADQVTDAQAALAVPDIASACSALDIFKAHVTAQSGKKFTAAVGAQFTADANAIQAAIPCP